MARKPGKKVRWVQDNGVDVVGLRYADKKDRVQRKYRQYYTILPDSGKHVYFGKNDELDAIRRFRAWQAKQTGEQVEFIRDVPVNEFLGDFMKVLKPPSHEVIIKDGKLSSAIAVTKIPENAYIERVRDDLLNRPKLLAQQTGVEWVAYGDKLQKPEPSITLKVLADLYFNRPDQPDRDDNKTKNQNYWKEFCRLTKSKTVADLDADNIGHYADTIIRKRRSRNLSASWVRNKYFIVKRILSYGLQRGQDVNRLPQVLILCQMMVPPKLDETQSQPIEVEDYHKLLNAADIKWKAILLLSLNMAMKPAAIAKTLKKDAFLDDGYFSNDRPKTKQKRVGILWQRTIDAIKAYQQAETHKSEFLFVNGDDKPYVNGDAVTSSFPKLRKLAGLPATVYFEHLRDGSITHGDDGTDFIKLVAGHKCGIKGLYRAKLAKKTEKVIKMIEDHYFPKTETKKGGKKN